MRPCRCACNRRMRERVAQGRGQSSGTEREVRKENSYSSCFLLSGAAAAHIACRQQLKFLARCIWIKSLYPISQHWSIVIGILFYHSKHTRVNGALVLHRYNRNIRCKRTRLYTASINFPDVPAKPCISSIAQLVSIGRDSIMSTGKFLVGLPWTTAGGAPILR